MASPYLYINSGGSVGARLATRRPVYSSGQRWYLSSVIGNDTYNGRNREKPFATLSAAHTAAAAGDIIQALPGHSENLAAAQTFNKAGIKLLGEGEGASLPRFTCTGTVNMFDVTAAGLLFESIYFPASTAVATSRVRVATANVRFYGCTWECGASDTNRAVSLITGASQVRFYGCEFKSTASVVTAQPAVGLEVVNAVTDVELEQVIFNGGTVGFSDYALKGTAAITRFLGIDVQFINEADFFFATGTSGDFHISSGSGSARGQWDA